MRHVYDGEYVLGVVTCWYLAGVCKKSAYYVMLSYKILLLYFTHLSSMRV